MFFQQLGPHFLYNTRQAFSFQHWAGPTTEKQMGPTSEKQVSPTAEKQVGPTLKKKETAPGGDIDTEDLLRPMCRKKNAAQVAEEQFPGPDVNKSDGL